MKRMDLVILFLTIIAVFLLVYPPTSRPFFDFTNEYALLGGFIKFFLFASFGDVLSQRIRKGNFAVTGLFYKAIVWGFIGVVVVFVFRIFSGGVMLLQDEGLLPFAGVTFAFAFFTSLFMNVIFGPTMMFFHRVTDHYIERKVRMKHHTLKETLNDIDYKGFVSFIVFKTIPLFWIPAHTITFMMREEYRVLFASFLGVMLGLILGLAKQSVKKEA